MVENLFKKVFTVLCFLLLFISCDNKKDETVYLLTNEEKIVAFSKEKNNLLVLTFTPSTVQAVVDAESITSQELFKQLYDVQNISVKNVSVEDFTHLRRLFNSLEFISGEEDGISSFVILEKGLRKTQFVDTINTLIADKNGDSFLSLLDKDKNIIVLSGDDFISHTAPWEERVSFFNTWCTEIGVYIK